MAMCLVAVKIVRERDRKQKVRLAAEESLPPTDDDSVLDDDDEVVYLQKGIVVILLAGLLPVLVWLSFYLFCPELLHIDMTPTAKQSAEQHGTCRTSPPIQCSDAFHEVKARIEARRRIPRSDFVILLDDAFTG